VLFAFSCSYVKVGGVGQSLCGNLEIHPFDVAFLARVTGNLQKSKQKKNLKKYANEFYVFH
jgi:hypothetical protein